MKTINCPNKDQGVCTVPDRTALVTADEIRPITREEAVLLSPDLEFETTALARVDASREDVRDVLGNAEHRRGEQVAFALRAAFDETPGHRSLVIYCTPCGHIWLKDLP